MTNTTFIIFSHTWVSSVSYRVDTEAVCVSDAKGVVFVREDDNIRDRVDTHGVVICPEYGADIQRQGSQVTLG